MRGSQTLWLALLLAAGFTWGVLHLLVVEFSAGSVYPEYSSLRTDPIGSKLLFDSLAGMPGLRVTRNYTPLDYLQSTGATVMLLAIPASALENPQFVQGVRKLAERGNRVVVTLPVLSSEQTAAFETLRSALNFRVVAPESGSHSHELYFTDAKGWTALDREDEKLFVIERKFGNGQVVLFADSDPFSNGSTIALDRLKQVSTAIGSNRAVVFDEAHLGIAESGSVVELARRYRLMGLALGLAIWAALAIWRSASAFPLPAAAREVERLSGRTSFAGLVTLLGRHIPARDLVSLCWQEWLRTNRNSIKPERAARASAIAAGAAGRPLEAVREIQAVVQAKGEV